MSLLKHLFRSCGSRRAGGTAIVLLALGGSVAAAEMPLAMLTSARQVIDLGMEGARLNPHPVQFRGVLTYVAVSHRDWIFVQDETAGVLVTYSEFDGVPKAGQLVEVEGVAGVGAFHTYVKNARVSVVGESKFPSPRRTPIEQLTKGADFGHWVRLRCSVRDAGVEDDRLVFQVQTEGHPFYVWVRRPDGWGLPAEWIDADLEVDGVAWTVTDSSHRPYSVRLHVPDMTHVRVLRPGSTNTFDKPLATTRSLREVSRDPDQRVKVRGVVTYAEPDGSSVCLQDETGPASAYLLLPIRNEQVFLHGLRTGRAKSVKTRPGRTLRVGDRIELVGSPITKAPLAPVLHAGEYRVLSHGDPPPPRVLSASEALLPENDYKLVRLRARFVDRDQVPVGKQTVSRLWLEADGLIFEARFASGGAGIGDIADNSLLEVTGVCSSIVGELRKARGVRLRMRDEGDVQVLHAPEPWLGARTGRVLLIACGVLIVVLGWVALLRRQVQQRTAELRESNRALEKQVAEHQRIQSVLAKSEEDMQRALIREKELGALKTSFVSLVSHEFRTPLGVIMSATEVLDRYFDRLPAEKRRKHLDMVFRATRNLAELVEGVLLLGKVEQGRMQFTPAPIDLGEFCRELVDEIQSATGRRCPIELTLEPGLPPGVGDAGLLRHVISNVLTNAVKYSETGRPVEFDVEGRGDQAVFRVRDHGIGIPEEDREQLFKSFARGRNVGSIPGTGLGLLIVKRCVDLHGGAIEIHSRPGDGTTVIVALPLFAGRTLESRDLRISDVS